MTLAQVRDDLADIVADNLSITCQSLWTGHFGPNEAQIRWGAGVDWLDADADVASFCTPGVQMGVMLTANKQDLAGAQVWLETKVTELWALAGTALPNAGGQFPRCRTASEPTELLDMQFQPSGLLGVLVNFYPIPHTL